MRVFAGENSSRAADLQGNRMIPGSRRISPQKRGAPEAYHLRPASVDHRPHSTSRKAVLYLRPLSGTGTRLQFQTFDADYIEALCAGDHRVQEHFVGYFTELIHLKIRSRLQSRQAQEDVRQETFARVLTTLRKESGLRQPERLGAFVNTVCNNVLFEHYRSSSRQQSLDAEEQPELPMGGASVDDIVAGRQLKDKVREILSGLSTRDRSLLQAIFLEERDREEDCREMGVDGEYLRVLLFRAKQSFRSAYLKRMGGANA
jgi:RNA polymerase sigma-70 factor (ECF subfamily)